MDQNKVPNVHPIMPSNGLEGNIHVRIGKTSMIEEKIQEKSEANVSGDRTMKLSQKSQPSAANARNKSQEKMRRDFTVPNGKSTCVFEGKIFCFSSSFPEDRVCCEDFFLFLHVTLSKMFNMHLRVYITLLW